MNDPVFKSGERMVLVAMACAFACMLLSVLMGALGALYYVPAFSRPMANAGISLVQIRPLHTTFASAWIYLGCVACMYWFLFETFGEPNRGERRRYRAHMVCWGLAGIATIVTLPLGITSGREYLGFHPLISVSILVGWVLFLWTFLRRVRRGFWSRPVYVYMWTAGACLFVYTFAEGHAHLLPFVSSQPVADLQIQWKSCGTLVASFNQMVYGSLLYVGERLSRDRSVAQSRSAFALFGLGLLNSFTNYTHHTYHLPQSHLVKWVAFVVSMLEIIILWSLLRDIVGKLGRPKVLGASFGAAKRFLSLSKHWNVFLLPVALLISVPPFNALIHGTHVVMAHAMGSELAIDSYILLGAFAWILSRIFPKGEVRASVIDGPRVERTVRALNLALMALVGCLLVGGLTVGATRYIGRPLPEWMSAFPVLFGIFGMSVGYSLVRLMWAWLPLFREPIRHKLFRHDARWQLLVANAAARRVEEHSSA